MGYFVEKYRLINGTRYGPYIHEVESIRHGPGDADVEQFHIRYLGKAGAGLAAGRAGKGGKRGVGGKGREAGKAGDVGRAGGEGKAGKAGQAGRGGKIARSPRPGEPGSRGGKLGRGDGSKQARLKNAVERINAEKTGAANKGTKSGRK